MMDINIVHDMQRSNKLASAHFYRNEGRHSEVFIIFLFATFVVFLKSVFGK